ncbi:riboflavin kinase / FAD synthetase domain containing protein [Babesia bovis T2Bo]|uniref:riboflavin kinase n=1 Tax=Babesia bovis TaxID=5865 RepID=A7AWJ9_BABBO|nr:riboflavin kinase / FAD synthetase domain containing protein [Babesia bovis T2Bo]EDO05427.1 riboflavin kinase / FAD synthetase domain containing protein [Babesia bovis T2Bo]|eukprot:XP_001608995.1 riboflavin kinase / FAD synthetase domain containing protein [Babesia bovis T2Bo]
MVESEDHACHKNIVIIVDADTCVIDTKTALINVLGTVANIHRRSLRSPWASNASKEIESLKSSVKSTCDHATRQAKADTSARRSSEVTKSTSSNIREDLLHIPNGGVKHINGIVKTYCVGFPEFINDQRVLQKLIYNIKEEVIPSASTIRKALLLGDSLIQCANKFNAEKVESLKQVYTSSHISYIRTDGSIKRLQIVDETESLELTPLSEFVESIALASYQRQTQLDFLDHSGDAVKRLLEVAGFDVSLVSVQVVFTAQLPAALRKLINIAGTLQSVGFNIDFVHPQEIASYSEKGGPVNYILYPKESPVIDYIFNQLQISSLVKLVNKSVFTQGCTAEDSETNKVNLLKEPEINLFKGLAAAYLRFTVPVIIQGTVIEGFGRGASSLGVPTANLDCSSIPHLVPGVYFGTCRLQGNAEVDPNTILDTILSVGFNPHFDHATYSIEPYIYHSFNYPLLGQHLELNIKGLLRTEARFDSLGHLIAAIQTDILEHKLIVSKWES